MAPKVRSKKKTSTAEAVHSGVQPADVAEGDLRWASPGLDGRLRGSRSAPNDVDFTENAAVKQWFNYRNLLQRFCLTQPQHNYFCSLLGDQANRTTLAGPLSKALWRYRLTICKSDACPDDAEAIFGPASSSSETAKAWVRTTQVFLPTSTMLGREVQTGFDFGLIRTVSEVTTPLLCSLDLAVCCQHNFLRSLATVAVGLWR